MSRLLIEIDRPYIPTVSYNIEKVPFYGTYYYVNEVYIMVKKRLITAFLLVGAMFMVAACGNGEKSKEGAGKSAQIAFNGSSTLAPVVSKIATDFTEKNVKWNKVDSSFPMKILRFTFLPAAPVRALKQFSTRPPTSAL